MNRDDYDLFTLLCQSHQTRLQKILPKVLKKHYDEVIVTKDYILAKGNIPVGLVAHMDTVFTYPPQEIFYDRSKNVIWSPDGLGADDRAGVFLVLKVLQYSSKDKMPTIIFTTDEEKGGLGARSLIKDYPTIPWDLKYLIQLDRCGEDDCVFYDDDNDDFMEYVEQFGFKTNWGTFSDISIICPQWGCSGVNLSVGYEDEHFEIERLYVTYTYATLEKVLNMIDVIDDAPAFKYIEHPYYSKIMQVYPGYDDQNYGYASHKCHTYIPKSLIIKVKDGFGLPEYYCPDCINSDEIHWCTKCGEPFIASSPYDKLCVDCIDRSFQTEVKNVPRVQRHSRKI